MARLVVGPWQKSLVRCGFGALASILLVLSFSSLASAEVLPFEVSEYRKDFGVSAASAKDALETQEEGAETAIEAGLEANLGKDYAGIWFDNQAGEFVVPVTDASDRSAITSEFAAAGLQPEYRTATATSTWAELEAAQERLNRALAVPMSEGLIQTSLDPRSNAVLVNWAEGLGDNGLALLQKEAAVADVDVKLVRLPQTSLGAVPAACGELYGWAACDPPLRGGVEIGEDGFITDCTAGFKATGRTNSNRYVVSAGHCALLGGSNVQYWMSKDSKDIERYLGYTEQAQWGKGTDLLKINANGTYWDVSPWPSQIVEWGTSGGLPKDPAHAISSEGSSFVGQYACHSGAVTGSTCGNVTQVNVSVSGKYGSESYTVNHMAKLSPVCSSQGDSGGPVYAGNMALGMVSFVDAELPKCSNYVLYTDILEDTDLMNVTVGTRTTTTSITQATALNGNPGWATVVGTVYGPGGATINGKTVNIKFFKWNVSTTKWDLKATVPTAVNNNKFELVNWNGVGNGSWIAQAEFPSQAPYGGSSSSTVTEGAFTVKDGYRFKVKHTEKCLDVYAGLTANGTAINQWDCLNPATTSNQVFTMVPTGSNGAVRIVARHSNRCVSVKGGSTAPGTYLEQYDCAGGEQPGQTWRTEKVTGNWSRLIAKHSNQCMDVRGQETANGVPVTQYTCLGTQANQMWEIQSVDAGPIPTQTELYVPDGETLYGRPYGYSTAYGYVRTGAYNIAGNTLKLSYYKQNGAGNYEYIKAVNPTINSEGRFEVKYEGFGPGEWIVKADFPGVGNFAASGSPERWFHVGDGYRYVFRHSGKCLSLNGNANYNGNYFVQWDCAPVATPYDGQVFAMHPIEGGARFNITVNSTGRCLDVTGASTGNGAAFQQWDCNGGDQQRFQVIPIAGQAPWNALIAKHSNKCMDVYSQYTSNGALIHQWECLWPASQQWQFQRIG